MRFLLSVVPIIIPSSPEVRAEVAADLCTFGEWMLLGFCLFCIYSGVEAVIRGIVRLVRYFKNRRNGGNS